MHNQKRIPCKSKKKAEVHDKGRIPREEKPSDENMIKIKEFDSDSRFE
jgi:hypothetical protein